MIDKKIEKSESQFDNRQSSRQAFNRDAYRGGFRDLNVYQTLLEGVEIVHSKIIPSLPEVEKYGLADQLRRSSKSPLALLAEGYAKRRHQRSWIKYLEDCIGECNETICHLDIALRSYPKHIPQLDCLKAMDIYDKASR